MARNIHHSSRARPAPPKKGAGLRIFSGLTIRSRRQNVYPAANRTSLFIFYIIAWGGAGVKEAGITPEKRGKLEKKPGNGSAGADVPRHDGTNRAISQNMLTDVIICRDGNGKNPQFPEKAVERFRLFPPISAAFVWGSYKKVFHFFQIEAAILHFEQNKCACFVQYVDFKTFFCLTIDISTVNLYNMHRK